MWKLKDGTVVTDKHWNVELVTFGGQFAWRVEEENGFTFYSINCENELYLADADYWVVPFEEWEQFAKNWYYDAFLEMYDEEE